MACEYISNVTVTPTATDPATGRVTTFNVTFDSTPECAYTEVSTTCSNDVRDADRDIPYNFGFNNDAKCACNSILEILIRCFDKEFAPREPLCTACFVVNLPWLLNTPVAATQCPQVTLTVRPGECQPRTGRFSDSSYEIDFKPDLPVDASYSFSLDLGDKVTVVTLQGGAAGPDVLDSVTGTAPRYIRSGTFTPTIRGTITINGLVCNVSAKGAAVRVPPCCTPKVKLVKKIAAVAVGAALAMMLACLYVPTLCWG